MHRAYLIYRHHDGDIEGFVGLGFTGSVAVSDAIRRSAQACRCRSIPFVPDGLFVSEESLTDAERKSVHDDWRIPSE